MSERALQRERERQKEAFRFVLGEFLNDFSYILYDFTVACGGKDIQ